jgi:peptidoglycan/xylan/chitin deacetylase (PgdA/CDA1 family)
MPSIHKKIEVGSIWILILIYLFAFHISVFAGNDGSLTKIKKRIKSQYKNTPAGNFIMPSNHCLNTDEKEALQKFIPEMKSKGYRFVKLREYGVTGK